LHGTIILLYICPNKNDKGGSLGYRQKESHKNKHKMKKLLTTALLAATTLAAVAQKSNAAQVIYDDLQGKDNVTTLSLNKQMLDAIDTDFDLNDQTKHLKGDISSVKLMLIDDDANSAKTVTDIRKKLGKLGYREIEIDDDKESPAGDKEVWVFSNKKGSRFTEAHFVVQDDDGSGVLLSVYGDFVLTDEKQ
jgi:hypothetical protein